MIKVSTTQDKTNTATYIKNYNKAISKQFGTFAPFPMVGWQGVDTGTNAKQAQFSLGWIRG